MRFQTLDIENRVIRKLGKHLFNKTLRKKIRFFDKFGEMNNNWAYPPPYQSGVGLSGTLSTPLSLRYVQTTPTIPYARNEQPLNLSKNQKILHTIFFIKFKILNISHLRHKF